MLDHDKLMEQFAGDVELVVNIIDIFENSYHEMDQQIQKAIADQDAKQLEISAHTLKGASSYFHYKDLTDKLLVIEKKGSAADFSDVSDLYKTAKDLCDELLSELIKYKQEKAG